jgi:GxxExxY protein
MPELLHRELTGDLIGAYYEVYNHTPRTYPEAIFESALVVEIRQRGHEVTRQDEYQIFYKERLVGVQRLDLFVVETVVVEIYGNACYHELRLRGLAVKPLKRMTVEYKGVTIGTVAFRHLIVEGQVMVFPVALRSIQQMRLDGLKDWMRACGIRLGILANFNTVRLDPVFVRA